MGAEESRERDSAKVAITVALIGAAATIIAALITLVPNLRSQPEQERSPADPPSAEVEPTPKDPPPPFKARMDDCVGKWRWRTRDRSLNFDLEADGSFTVEDFPDRRNPEEGFGLVSKGKGHWSVEGGRLTVTMTHVWTGLFWKEYEVTWIDAKKIAAVLRNEVTLEGTAPLRRR
jgi:hypothetical protein